MPEQVDVYYDGWGEHWRWGTLVSSNAITGRPLIAFEYSDEAKLRGLELSAYKLPVPKAARFQNKKSFMQAFTGWTGKTPGEFRGVVMPLKTHYYQPDSGSTNA